MNRIAEPILTIFTPTYNRAHTLPRTYESLCRQNCKNFIWLIVDDGSADNTAELVRDWQSRDNGFSISTRKMAACTRLTMRPTPISTRN